jgi:hypothetical protein
MWLTVPMKYATKCYTFSDRFSAVNGHELEVVSDWRIIREQWWYDTDMGEPKYSERN